MNLRGLPLYLPVLLAAGLAILPASYLIFGSLWSADPGLPGQLTSQNFAAVASDPTLGAVLFNSVAYSLGAALFAAVLAFILAIALQRTDAPLKRFMTSSLLVSLAIPWMVEDIAWTYLLSPRIGLYNIWLGQLFGIGDSLLNIYSIWGLIWVMGLSLTPLAYLIISPSLSLVDPHLEEASLVSGARLRTTFFRIDLPLSLPSILSALLLCTVIALEAFDASAIIGIPGRVWTLTNSIYGQTVQTPPNFEVASAYAVILVAMTLTLILLYSRSIRLSQRYVTVSGRTGRPRTFSLGRYRWFVAGGFITYLFVYLVPVLSVLVFVSLHNFWNPTDLPPITLANYENLLIFPSIDTGIFNSAIVSVTAAVATAALAFFLSYTSTRRRSVIGRSAELLASLPLAFPTIVLGIGLLWALLRSPLPIYGTVWALTLAYTIRYVPIVSRFLSGPLVQLAKELEEVSRICGAGVATTLRRIVFPLLKPSLIAGAVYVFVVSIKDLGAAVMLTTGDSALFSSALYNLWTHGDELVAVAGGILYVGVLSGALLILAIILKIDLFSIMSPEGRRAKSGN